MTSLLRYCVVGLVAFVIDYSATALLVRVLPLLVANTLGFWIANIANFVLAHLWVFGRGYAMGKLFRAYVAVLAISIMGLILNDLIVWITVAQVEMSLLSGKITAAALVLLWNYFARVAIVYKKDSQAS